LILFVSLLLLLVLLPADSPRVFVLFLSISF
jgi:hypothetical protein